LVIIGITAAIGFTVSLFFATAAFPAGAALAETKMGALLSFGAAPLALVASRLLGDCRSTRVTVPTAFSGSFASQRGWTTSS
jgi:NhaA family Na+:H+ antiporter